MSPYVFRVLKFTLPLLVVSFSVISSYSQVGGQTLDVADEDCLACHEDFDKSLMPTTHRLSSTVDNPSMMIACVSCHKGADMHLDDPGRGTIGNPAVMESFRVEKICTDCHDAHLQAYTAGFDPHAGLDLSCTSCHTVHGTNEYLLIDPSGGFCGTCHVAVVNEFRKRSNHPLTGQNIGCIDCHSLVSAGEPDYGHGGGVICTNCHPLQSGPYLFEHEATSSFTPEGSGCVSCHSPHGSSNDRLLNQPDDRLCLQCHGTPPGHLTAHGGSMAGYACLDCHSEIHGSYDNLYLLDPQLGSKLGSGPDDCFCHYYR
ncbi:MAG: cytochrome c3 family protein [Candidatus Zixiibacteriota bacterium]